MMTWDRQFGDALIDWSVPSRPKDAPLSGRYVCLEPLNADRHAKALYACYAEQDEVWDYLPYGPFATYSEYHSWVADVAGAADPFFFAVRNLKNESYEGVLSFLRITPESGSIEVGHINFSPRLQGTPPATEALYLTLAWAFSAGYRRFEWKCDALNLASRRAAQRLGLSYEGVFRQATIYKNRNRDTAWFAGIDAEWPALQRAYETWLDPVNFDQEGRQVQRLSELTRPILVARDPALER